MPTVNNLGIFALSGVVSLEVERDAVYRLKKVSILLESETKQTYHYVWFS